MAKPANSIATIKLPDDSSARYIVPYYLAYSKTNNYVATLPELTADDVIVTTKTAQTISGAKTFTNDITIDSTKKINFNGANVASIGWSAGGYITVNNLKVGSYLLPGGGNNTGGIGLSSIRWKDYYGVKGDFSSNVTIGGTIKHSSYTYTLPSATGTLSLEIDIVDLTSI